MLPLSRFASADHVGGASEVPATKPRFVASQEPPGNISNRRGFRRPGQFQAMISAIIVIALISLLVATEPESAGHAMTPSPEPPLQPASKKPEAERAPPERLAA